MRVAGALAVTEGVDTLAGAGAIRITGALAATEGADAFASTGILSRITIAGTIQESVGDTAVGAFYYRHYLTGAVVEASGDIAVGAIGRESTYTEIAALGGIRVLPAIGAEIRTVHALGGSPRIRRHP